MALHHAGHRSHHLVLVEQVEGLYIDPPVPPSRIERGKPSTCPAS